MNSTATNSVILRSQRPISIGKAQTITESGPLSSCLSTAGSQTQTTTTFFQNVPVILPTSPVKYTTTTTTAQIPATKIIEKQVLIEDTEKLEKLKQENNLWFKQYQELEKQLELKIEENNLIWEKKLEEALEKSHEESKKSSEYWKERCNQHIVEKQVLEKNKNNQEEELLKVSLQVKELQNQFQNLKKSKDEELQKLKIYNNKLENTIQEKDALIQKKERNLNEKDEEINRINQDHKQTQEEVSYLNGCMNEQSNEISELKSQVKDRDDELEKHIDDKNKIQDVIVNQSMAIDQLKKHHEDAVDENENLRSSHAQVINYHSDQSSQLQQVINDKDGYIKLLQDQLHDMEVTKQIQQLQAKQIQELESHNRKLRDSNVQNLRMSQSPSSQNFGGMNVSRTIVTQQSSSNNNVNPLGTSQYNPLLLQNTIPSGNLSGNQSPQVQRSQFSPGNINIQDQSQQSTFSYTGGSIIEKDGSNFSQYYNNINNQN